MIEADPPKHASIRERDGHLSIQLFPKTPHDRALWEDFKREMRAVVCRADQSLAEYDASVFAQQEFETQQEQLLAKGRLSTAGRAGLLRTFEVRRESLDDIHGALPQLAHLVADHAQNMAALVKLSERFALADATCSPDALPAEPAPPAAARDDADCRDFATAEELLGETEARRALLLAKLERTRTAVIGRRGRAHTY
jgi:hypothetical protein